MNTKLRLGAIGCGGHACSAHFPAIQRIPELQLVAVCDLDLTRLTAVAGQYGVKAVYTDYETMLAQVELDAVSIIGPPALHVQAAKVCLQRQIPFLVEKPLAIHGNDARELLAVAQQYGDCGQVGFTSRYAPAQRLAWRLAHQPEFGPLVSVATTHLTMGGMHPFWEIADPVEAFVNLHGVHAIDLWRFFGGEPQEVSATLAGVKPHPNEAYAYGSVLAVVRVPGGPHGTIHIKAGASHNGDINSDLMGHHTRIRVENDQELTYECHHDWIQRAMADDPLADTFLMEQPAGHFLGTGLMMYDYMDFFRFQWMAFARAVLAGKPLSPSIQDGCRSALLTEALCASLRQDGAWIKITQP